MRIELDHPHRPDWVRDDDVIGTRFYTKGVGYGNVPADYRGVVWDDLLAFEIPETTPTPSRPAGASSHGSKEDADFASEEAFFNRLGVLTVTICGDDVQARFEKG